MAENIFSELTKTKNNPTPEKSGVGYKMYSTVPPWLQIALPLIDAVTGAPGLPFPTVGSEGVVTLQGNEAISPGRLLSENLTKRHVFLIAFIEN